MLGHTVLEIDAHTSPVFFQPPGDEGQYPPLKTLTVLQGATVDTLLTALSLVSNRRVAVAYSGTITAMPLPSPTEAPRAWPARGQRHCGCLVGVRPMTHPQTLPSSPSSVHVLPIWIPTVLAEPGHSWMSSNDAWTPTLDFGSL